jgi:spore coat polysaccharide biosynthesis protein SpsF
MDALSRVVRMADSDRLREHVTLAIYENANRFQIGSIRNPTDMSDLRWTVDTSQDLALINQIHHHFGQRNFNWRDVMDAYKTHPHWRQINGNVLQKSA